MKSFRLALLFILLAPVFSASAFGQQIDIGSRIQQIEKMVTEEMEKNSVPGISIAIAQNGRIVYSKGFGYADLENKVPFTALTVSRIGSVSKTFTALAVMKLVEQGKINLDDEVQTYVPTFPKKNAPITIRQLLCHQSGIRHYKGNEFSSNQQFNDVESTLAIFKDDPLLHQPGEKFSYTTYGYSLLSRVVETASGESFPNYLQKHIIEPIELKHTYLDQPSRIIPLRARNYTKSAGKPIENAPAVNQSNKWGGGGLLSTVEDLIKYASAYSSEKLARRDTIKKMFTSQKTSDGKPTAYGLGWAIASDQGKPRVEHSGGSMGATAILTIYPEQNLIIAALVNCDHYGAPQFKNRIANLLFNNPEQPK